MCWGFLVVGYLWVGLKHWNKNGDHAQSEEWQINTGAQETPSPTPGLNNRPVDFSAQEEEHGDVAGGGEADDRYYEVLGLQTGATKEQVKQAHRDLVKVWHPDRFDDDRLRRKAEAKLKEVNEAYQQLRSQFASSDVPVHDIYKPDLIAAVQSVTDMANAALAEAQDIDRRFNAGEYARIADAQHALDGMVARAEATSVVMKEAIHRVQEEAAAAGVTLPKLNDMQKDMDERIRHFQQLKNRRTGR
jgi:hypothetical protein